MSGILLQPAGEKGPAIILTLEKRADLAEAESERGENFSLEQAEAPQANPGLFE